MKVESTGNKTIQLIENTQVCMCMDVFSTIMYFSADKEPVPTDHKQQSLQELLDDFIRGNAQAVVM